MKSFKAFLLNCFLVILEVCLYDKLLVFCYGLKGKINHKARKRNFYVYRFIIIHRGLMWKR
ncbi:MAG: hypothetical protein DWB56_00420 [Candidatus Jettenia sp.]|uniref:Uncharacterized protein n=1 Tax=Candidatus Jettenia caeni TaxID=247490 RepID=I3ILG4_9BACT|nr:MAG: hypothetical protein EDM77_00425 [Candidatus Jettenia sp. AMX1]MBC6927417.1 hypothetical protein [Candidatus Jettenia sp.]MCE7879101.1 hypothetical protein [Candidatus Jettenia sp. AMX1]MCQ3925847.1 hypothetical protein [Candidatus Jettenia sp.]GAB62559.1 hypothetical protein KSU1_C0963 [Candidatus Jettenia caeni]